MSGVAVFSDLDRTLVYSPSALLLTMPDEEAPRLLCVEVYQGRPLSFVTERAAGGIGALTEAGVLVPVTTRTPEQYRRIHLPGPTPKFALTANGGRLLRDGEEDLDYTAALDARLAGEGAPYDEVWSHLQELAGSEAGSAFVEKARGADGLFCYAVVDRDALPAGWVEELGGYCTERGWTVSVQGRKVYCVPVGLSKGTAMREVAVMLGSRTVAAAGDSLLDRELLEAADVAIRPAHGELADSGWTAPHLTVTRGRGAAAGEEIVDWMVALAL
ncbi:HAD family hydrolase [Nocardioides sp. DS6]|uniref:HAD family hydrolase n=1 Tax=Nocardioides eburneus TaxID=3231482 RepID=A0ABV3T1H2_9ACTN